MPTVLITRPQETAQAFADAVRKRIGAAARCVISPIMRIEPTRAVIEPAEDETLIFTSAQGVAAYVQAGGRCDLDCFAVGGVTGAAARAAGLVVREAAGDAESLLKLILQSPPPAGVLHLHGEHSRGNVVARLRAAGIAAREAVLYRQLAQPLSDQALALLDDVGGAVVLPIFSPRSATLLAAQPRGRAPLLIAALSPAVAQEAKALHPREILQATELNGEAMVDAVAALWRMGQSLEKGTPAQ